METPMAKEKRELFEKLVAEVEVKHSDYFNGRFNLLENRPEKISDHYIFRNENNSQFSLIWLKESDLREDIQEEVVQIFRQVYP